nr:hypothetical transcript [Hymenolepis microstoma]
MVPKFKVVNGEFAVEDRHSGGGKKLLKMQNLPRQISTHNFPDGERAVKSRLTGRYTKLWELYNEVVYPPREKLESVTEDENMTTTRPAEVTYTKENILYSQKKLWLLGFMQLGFRPEKGARILEQVLALEAAIKKAITEHDVEFCTNLWVGKFEAFGF